MRLKIIAVILLIPIFLVACNGTSTEEETRPKDNEAMDIKELVQHYSEGNITDESAYITSTQLIIIESDDNEIVYDLPEDEFFVSIAPFINETHP